MCRIAQAIVLIISCIVSNSRSNLPLALLQRARTRTSDRTVAARLISVKGNKELNDPLGAPAAINDLDIRNQYLTFERPYFDPSFQDLTTPQVRPYRVERIAQNVFLLKSFMTSWECESIIHEAKCNYNMTEAKSVDDEKSRTNCKVAWLGDARLGGILEMIGKSAENAFVSIRAKESPMSRRSDLQVLHYAEGGQFTLHHDGLDRILTVITYLNGVGETWLPLVNVGDKKGDYVEKCTCLEEAISQVADNEMVPGKDGILVSGDSVLNNPHVVLVEQGDAVAFYSYDSEGGEDWQSIHAGLPCRYDEDGKWIATYWFHAPSLTIDEEIKTRG